MSPTGRRAPLREPNMQNIPIRTPEGRKIREAFTQALAGDLTTVAESAIRLVLEDLGVDPDELINIDGESRLERYLRKLG